MRVGRKIILFGVELSFFDFRFQNFDSFEKDFYIEIQNQIDQRMTQLHAWSYQRFWNIFCLKFSDVLNPKMKFYCNFSQEGGKL